MGIREWVIIGTAIAVLVLLVSDLREAAVAILSAIAEVAIAILDVFRDTIDGLPRNP